MADEHGHGGGVELAPPTALVAVPATQIVDDKGAAAGGGGGVAIARATTVDKEKEPISL